MASINVAVCSLNQLALDFAGNLEHIMQSIATAKDRGAGLRVGPELEIPGYSCEDAFFELDTTVHSWEVLAEILKADFRDIIVDVGMPVLHDSTLYNCRVILLNKKIVLIRPKTKLAGNGNYREERWFTAWDPSKTSSVWFKLPPIVREITSQAWVPFGANVILEVEGCSNSGTSASIRIGWEICEELWRADASHIKLFGERGCHIICNSSGSYWEIRKLDRVLELMKTATAKSGGVYAFSNLLGCDGGRLCFYGRSLITLNGQLLTKTTNSRADIFDEVQVVVGRVSVNDIDSFRLQSGVKVQSHRDSGKILEFDASGQGYECGLPLLDNLKISVGNFACEPVHSLDLLVYGTQGNEAPSLHVRPEEEIFIYSSLWLWDYLRKSSMAGFIVPLSGGIDSGSVACIVYAMCTLLFEHLKKPVSLTQRTRKLLNVTAENYSSTITSPNDICGRLLRSCYLSTKFSGTHSRDRATKLAALLGAQFVDFDFNHLYEDISEKAPYFGVHARDPDSVSLLQQNIQARLRMVLAYYFSGGDRLVLASGNVDEALVGYLTKYDCSSADINPIGSISKQDLRSFMKYFEASVFGNAAPTAITSIVLATPSAELTGAEQSDEADLGLTYEELSIFGRLRRGEYGCYGPHGVFMKLWSERKSTTFRSQVKDIDEPSILATKVKRFFTLHARNRHKQTTLTPALHSETYSPDDNRFDHRQFLFDSNWTWQFKRIDQEVVKIEEQAKEV